jgi:hypothetical protein
MSESRTPSKRLVVIVVSLAVPAMATAAREVVVVRLPFLTCPRRFYARSALGFCIRMLGDFLPELLVPCRHAVDPSSLLNSRLDRCAWRRIGSFAFRSCAGRAKRRGG